MSNESIIQVFEGINVRIVWNEEEQEYYFSIADIVQVLTESTDVKQLYPYSNESCRRKVLQNPSG